MDHPEYTPLLREEIQTAQSSSDWVRHLHELPLLNSFIKESMRLHPADSITLRRKALQNFSMRGEITIPKGSWACLPLKVMQQDPKVFPNPNVFNGYRFMTQSNASDRAAGDCDKKKIVATKLTDINENFLIWGMGRRACPGRFFSTDVLRLMVVTVLQNYDLSLDTASENRTFSWKTAIIPKSSVRLGMSARMT